VLGRPPENAAVIAAQIKVGSAAGLIAELSASEELKIRKRSGLTRQDVRVAYRALLGREPSDATIRLDLESESAGALIESIARSQEYVTRKKDTAYLYYTAVFDPIAVILKHELRGRRAKPGHLVNFLGAAMNLAFAPRLFAGHPGGVEAVPIPANWHADMAEFGAVLRAVNLARNTFTMVELGCGWGCWMINSGVAARRMGLRVKLIGAEADEGHLGFAAEALATNGFQPRDYVLHRCIAAPESGSAFFPKQQITGQNWALEPLLAPSDSERATAIASGLYDEVPTQSLQSILGRNGRIDLLHIDIQGGERDLIRRSLAVLNERVAYLVVGTHSRSIEGELIEQLMAAGWLPEIERPAILGINDGKARVSTDGVQGWRNPRLLPLPQRTSQ
jgi:FkbM family methyltransferase